MIFIVAVNPASSALFDFFEEPAQNVTVCGVDFVIPSGYEWSNTKDYTGEGSVNNNLGRALDISNSPLIESVMTEENIANANGTLGANDTRKGYDVTSSYVESFLSGQDSNIFQSGSTYTMAGTYGNVSISRPDPTDPTELQFGFETNQTNTVCWFQEWARVIPEESATKAHSDDWTDGYTEGDYNIYWFESLDEKLENVILGRNVIGVRVYDRSIRAIYTLRNQS